MKYEREKEDKTYVCMSTEIPIKTIKVLYDTLRYFGHESQKKVSSCPQTPFLVYLYPVLNEIWYILWIRKRLKQNHRVYPIFIFTTIYIIHIFKFLFFFQTR